MAINDHSIYMEYLARSLATTGPESIDLLSGGTLSPQEQQDILTHIRTELQNSTWPSDGIVPNKLYYDVAEMIFASTPGMEIEAIVSILRVNHLFGIAKKISVKSMTSYQGADLYENQRQKSEDEVNTIQNKYCTGGLYSDIVCDLQNNPKTKIKSMTSTMVNAAGTSVVITDNLCASVNAITCGLPSVKFGSLPTGVQIACAPYVADGTISTRVSGKAVSVGGRTSVLVDASVDVNTGNFSVDFSSLTTKQKSKIAAEAIEAETGAVNADVETLASDLEKATSGGKTLADTDPFGTIDPNGTPVRIDASTIQPGGDNVTSVEELEFEMGSATRDISEIIVHWSETFSNANLNKDQIPNGGAYHYVILRDGAIQRSQPLNSTGSHCPINNHNAYSIGVCLVGGVNVSSGDENIEQTGANSITRSQFNSLYQIFRCFFNQYPGGQALGHMDVDITMEDPGFDVRDYVYNNFNKTSLYTDPLNQAALSPQDILSALDGQGPSIHKKDNEVMDKIF